MFKLYIILFFLSLSSFPHQLLAQYDRLMTMRSQQNFEVVLLLLLIGLALGPRAKVKAWAKAYH